jgi:hypothetical protein
LHDTAFAKDKFYAGKAKDIIDDIDRGLTKHYGHTDEELDVIPNYDIINRIEHVRREGVTNDTDESC